MKGSLVVLKFPHPSEPVRLLDAAGFSPDINNAMMAITAKSFIKVNPVGNLPFSRLGIPVSNGVF